MNAPNALKLAGSALVLVLSTAALAPASAQEAAARGPDPAFKTMDANHDGRLARSEIPADMVLMRTRFATYDRNQDGYLDAQEFAAAKLAMQGGGHAMGSGPATPQRSQSQGH